VVGTGKTTTPCDTTMTTAPAKTKPVFKVSLTDPVPDFPVTVTLSLLNGDQATLAVTCRHLRKTQWAAIRDAHTVADLQAKNKPKDPPAENPAAEADVADKAPFDVAAYFADNGVEKTVKEQLASGAALVLSFATGWDLAEPLDADNLCALEDKHGGAMRQIVAAYDMAIHQGRLGN
jgi:hypothetical protein